MCIKTTLDTRLKINRIINVTKEINRCTNNTNAMKNKLELVATLLLLLLLVCVS